MPYEVVGLINALPRIRRQAQNRHIAMRLGRRMLNCTDLEEVYVYNPNGKLIMTRNNTVGRWVYVLKGRIKVG